MELLGVKTVGTILQEKLIPLMDESEFEPRLLKAICLNLGVRLKLILGNLFLVQTITQTTFPVSPSSSFKKVNR